MAVRRKSTVAVTAEVALAQAAVGGMLIKEAVAATAQSRETRRRSDSKSSGKISRALLEEQKKAEAELERSRHKLALLETLSDDDTEVIEAISSRVVLSHCFTTKSPYRTSLYDMFLSALPTDAMRAAYNCNACRKFIDTYGGLVTVIPETGRTVSVFFSGDLSRFPPVFRTAILKLGKAVERSPISGVFLTSERILGTPTTGVWSHFHTTNHLVYKSQTKQAHERVAEYQTDFETLNRAISEYSLNTARNAAFIADSDELYRNEKVKGVADWFDDLQDRLASKPVLRSSKPISAIIWHAVATAPTGWAHIKSSMIGTLLEDIKNGLPLDVVKKRFAAKMHPLSYRRPQAPPAAQTVRRAESLIDQLGLARSLNRRYITSLDEIDSMWRHDHLTNSAARVRSMGSRLGGVFSGVMTKEDPPTVYGSYGATTKMSWAEFSAQVLPRATSIEVYVPRDNAPFIGLLTAMEYAPPLMQWDPLPDGRRNPVSWYVYNGGSQARNWHLTPLTWAKVTAVTRLPCHWYGYRAQNQSDGVILVIQGCRDVNAPSLGLFPEILRADLHEARAVIEGYSRIHTPSLRSQAVGCGMDLRQGHDWRTFGGALLQVGINGQLERFKLASWD